VVFPRVYRLIQAAQRRGGVLLSYPGGHAIARGR